MPEERWKSAYDLKCELKWVAERTAEKAPAEPPRARPRERLGWLVAVIIMALAGTLIGWRAASKNPDQRPIVRLYVPIPEVAAQTTVFKSSEFCGRVFRFARQAAQMEPCALQGVRRG